MSRSIRRVLIAAGLTVVLAATAACSSGGKSHSVSAGTADDPIRIGVVDSAKAYWKVFTDAAAAQGITVQLVNFSDYQLPNQGLADGDLDLNQFQHLQFLAQFNVKSKSDLVPIGATAVYPLGLYSKKHTSVDEIPGGGQVAIPNDPTNQARALLVLQAAGLVTLKDGGNSFSTPADILADQSKVKVLPVDAANTPLSLQDSDAAIINNDYVVNAGLSTTDAIFSDDPDSTAAQPYINIFVSRKADQNNPIFAKLIAIYHTDPVQAAAQEEWGGTAVFKNNSAAELQAILAGIEKNLKAQG